MFTEKQKKQIARIKRRNKQNEEKMKRLMEKPLPVLEDVIIDPKIVEKVEKRNKKKNK